MDWGSAAYRRGTEYVFLVIASAVAQTLLVPEPEQKELEHASAKKWAPSPYMAVTTHK
jgi:hypothetical protein